MTWMLIILVLGIALLGYYVAGRKDRSHAGKAPEFPSSIRRYGGILLYGEEKFLVKMRQEGIDCTALSGNRYPQNAAYSALLAVSADDWTNIVLTREARAADRELYIIARCNDISHYKEYKDAGADRILTPSEATEQILPELRGVRHVSR